MTTQAVRNIVHIDEERCDGCGLCIIACAEGALEIIDGKARLLSEQYCDGLGACLGECPQGAITIEERIAEKFDEELLQKHLNSGTPSVKDSLPSCPVMTITPMDQNTTPKNKHVDPRKRGKKPKNWPIQIRLVPPNAPFLKGADLVVTADCAPLIYADFHEDILGDRMLLIACPKLDDFQANQTRFTEILKTSQPRSITVVHMEVPCCSGLTYLVREAIKESNANITFKELTIGLDGNLKESLS